MATGDRSLTIILSQILRDGLIWWQIAEDLDPYQDILNRLEGFTKKYHTQQLIRGTLLFLCLGLLFWILVLSLELLLWMPPAWRSLLFWIFVAVEGFLAYRFILVPLLYLLRLKKGIDPKEASLLIGKHFPQVDDKLYNLLELSAHPEKSELLLASIEQRSKALGAVPFSRAIDLKEAFRVAKYVLLPLFILGIIWVSGNLISFFGSQERLINHQLAYERPAPFRFHLLNENLQVLDHQELTLEVAIEGDVRPEEVYLVVDGRQLLLRERDGIYTHTFEAPVPSTSFYFTANGWDSQVYGLRSLPTPSLLDFQMALDFPDYLGRRDEVVKGSGNAVVPEGTRINWSIRGEHVDRLLMQFGDSLVAFEKEGNQFSHGLRLFHDLDYQLSTSNSHVRDFEKLGYGLRVVRDAAPQVSVEQFRDSLDPNLSHYRGQASDDHGIRSIRVVCYPLDHKGGVQRVELDRPNAQLQPFYYSFPTGLELRPGIPYELYFEVVDNDGLRGGKTTESQRFTSQLLDEGQLRHRALEFQQATLARMDGSLQGLRDQQERLSKINQEQKQNKSLSFEDKGEIRDFLNRQLQQEAQMKKFSQELGESISKNQGDPKMQALLQERLQRQEEEAKRNAELLKELQKVAEKLEKDELEDRLRELGKNQGNNLRSLEQLLELTKRYYVTEKAAQLSRELDQMSKEQEGLADTKDRDSLVEDQGRLNQEFQGLKKELGELDKDNRGLKKPLGLGEYEKASEAIGKDQKDALMELGKESEPASDPREGDSRKDPGRSAQKQRSAAQKMKALSQSLAQGGGGGSSADSEDAEMLRQILDNLLRFSFEQETLFERINIDRADVSHFSQTVRDQQDLRRLFEHVDDSLFALSLRRVELSEFVNERISEVYYNLDRSLESMAENQMYQGAAHQQYVLNAANSLNDFLANVLDNMQQSLGQGGGSGNQQDFQLPDIIQGQQQLNQQLEGQGKQGKKSPDQTGENGAKGQGESREGKASQKGESERENHQGVASDEDLGLEEIYEIYKQQQRLREQLEEQLKNMIRQEDRELTQKLLRQMEEFQNDLLENGVTQRTLQKAHNIQHQLIKLEDAILEQGEDSQRESTADQRKYTNPVTTKPELLEDYRPGVEILNRQPLPLRRNYEERVKLYFKND